MKGLFSVLSFVAGFLFLSVAGYQYWGAYEVKLTRCQYVKHNIVPRNYYLLGIVVTCWFVDELQKPDGELVTWCNNRGVDIDKYDGVSLMEELKTRYPITSPPTFFDCWRAVGDYRRMFTYVPETQHWQNKFYAGILLIVIGLVSFSCTKIKSD